MSKRVIFLFVALLLGGSVYAQRPSWSVNESLFQQNATMICTINLYGVYLTSPNDLVGAFVGNECRGVTKPIFIASVNKYLCFLVIFSNTQGEEVTFKVYDSKKDQVVSIDTKLLFKINDQIGSFFQPFSIAYPKLSSEANLISFDLFNVKYDSLKTTTDLLSGIKTFNFHVRYDQKKDSIIPKYSISNGSKLYLGQQEIISTITSLNFKNTLQFQIKSEDESTLKPFNVNVINASAAPFCEDTLNNPKAKIISSIDTICSGDSIILTASSGSKYLWSTGDSTSFIKVRTSGIYSVSISYSNGCSSISSARSIVVNPKPSSLIVNNVSVCMGSESPVFNIVADSAHTIKWYRSDLNGYVSLDSMPVVKTDSATVKNFYVAQRNSFGCESGLASLLVNVLNVPKSIISASGPSVFCEGDSILLTTNSAAKYSWSTGDSTATLMVRKSGNYSVKLQFVNGCTTNATFGSVVVNPKPKTLSVGNLSICFGAILPALPVKPDTLHILKWYGIDSIGGSGTSIAPSMNSNQIGTTKYFVSQVNSFGCESLRSSLVVTVLESPKAVISGLASLCQGDTAILSSSTGFKYLWTTGDSTSSIRVHSSGSYGLKISLANGCSSEATPIEITVHPKPDLPSITNLSVCIGSTPSTLTATSILNHTLRWYGTQSIGGAFSVNGPQLTTNAVGVTKYYVSQISQYGCESARAEILYTVSDVNTPASITTDRPITICAGDSVVLNSSFGSSYLWNTGASTPSIKVKESGNYSVIITNANGCGATLSVSKNITFIDLPIKPVITNVSACVRSSMTELTAIPSSGNTIKWYGTSAIGGFGTSTPPIPSSATPGQFNYYLSQVNANGCESERTSLMVTILDAAIPIVTLTGSLNLCDGDSVLLASSTALKYLWSSGDTTTSIIIKKAGIYNVKVTYSNGCSAVSQDQSVKINPKPSVPMVNNIFACVGDPVGSLTANPTLGNRIKWYGTNAYGGIASTISPSPSSAVVGTTKYYVTQTNSFGCESERAILSVTINDLGTPASITTEGSSVLCQGDSVKLISSPGANYLWSTGSTASSIIVKSSGNYSVAISNANGCRNTLNASKTVIINPKPNAPIVSNISSCLGFPLSMLTATASPSNSLRWYGSNASGGTFNTSGPIPSTSSIGTNNYYVSQISAEGCESDRSLIVVTVNPLPTKPQISWNGEEFSVLQTFDSYQWIVNSNAISGASSNLHKPTVPGKYQIRVTNNFGCADTSAVFEIVVTAVNNLLANGKIAIYPNPTTNQLIVELEKIPLNTVEIMLFDLQGRVIRKLNTKHQRKIIDVSDLAKGNYILQLLDGNQRSVYNIIKQ